MLFSAEKKFVFIAVPKTGTTSVEQAWTEFDPSVLRNHLLLPNGQLVQVNKHISLRQVRHLLGKSARQYKFFAFLREPLDHTLSRYFYYANGRGFQRYKRGTIGKWTLGPKVVFTRLIPRSLWFLFYPLRTQIKSVVDEQGSVALSFCGRFSELNADFCKMISLAGYKKRPKQLSKTNAATRDTLSEAELKWLSFVVRTRLKPDVEFFERLQK